jgi:ribonucleotide monophosphatase NagD (HAD superfamily)
MIGNDRSTDIAGARKVGMATLYMHTALTPADQQAANPDLMPGIAPVDCRELEYEGEDWIRLAELIENL